MRRWRPLAQWTRRGSARRHGPPRRRAGCRRLPRAVALRRGGQLLGRARAVVTRDPVGMELFATTGDAFVRVGAHTRLQGSGAQCPPLDGDTVYVGCRGGGLKHSVVDPRFGHVVNHDFAGYHIAANADARSIEAHWLDRRIPTSTPCGPGASARSALSAPRRRSPTPCITPPASACETCRSPSTSCCERDGGRPP